MSGIRLSEKHGINPSLLQCPICGEEYAIAFLGRIKEDKKAPMVIAKDPCDKCNEYMKKGVIIVSCKDNDENYRTGKLAVVKSTTPFLSEECLGKELHDSIMLKRVVILEDSVWRDLEFLKNKNKETK